MGNENTTAVANKTTEKEFTTPLAIANNQFNEVIRKQMEYGGAQYSQYAASCVVAAIGQISTMIHQQGMKFNELNPSNLTDILTKIAALELNATASPRECYFTIRSVNVAAKGQAAKWEKTVELGIEGDGNDALLARFGRDVRKVGQYWLVRENDKFSYPKYNGLDMTPPQWEPSGSGKIVRIVYPILKKDGMVEFYIGERRDVINNLRAHISNNLMNETFGICKSRYDATAPQKEQIAAEKKKVIAKMNAKESIDAILDDEELQKFISPAWTELQSRELMIIRKIRNNIVKKIPKDFGSSIVSKEYNEVTDDTYKAVQTEINENANSKTFIPAQEGPKVIESVENDDASEIFDNESNGSEPEAETVIQSVEDSVGSMPAHAGF